LKRLSASVENTKIDEEIAEKLDVLSFSSTTKTIRLADLGCATGPNTFFAMQNVIKAIIHKYQSLSPTSPLPEFQVFFNDQVSNDFNTLFVALPPERKYFAAGVAGSFHNRLFPESSLHFVHSSYSLQWLSALPHYTSAPDEVFHAYSTQFAKDMDNFLNARAKELVPGGMMVLILSGIPKGMPYSQLPAGTMYNLLATILMDMAAEVSYSSYSFPGDNGLEFSRTFKDCYLWKTRKLLILIPQQLNFRHYCNCLFKF
jgi:SAM-dependent methyltransferase